MGRSRWRGRGGSLLTARTSLPQESQNLFCCLYRSWCHNPVTTVSLCFLTQNYRHAYDLIQKLYPSLLTLTEAWHEGTGGARRSLPPPRVAGRPRALVPALWSASRSGETRTRVGRGRVDLLSGSKRGYLGPHRGKPLQRMSCRRAERALKVRAPGGTGRVRSARRTFSWTPC